MFDFKRKSFWMYALIILLFPVFINFALFQKKFPLAYGNGDDWLSFWGNYSGGLISAFVAYIVANSQIQKQQKLDLEKEKFTRTINQLPALVRIKIELEKIIRELTKVKEERELFIEVKGGIRKDEDETFENFSNESTGVTEREVTDLSYIIELVNEENLKYIEQVENIDLHVNLITLFNFYIEFSNALLINVELTRERLEEIILDAMNKNMIATQLREDYFSINQVLSTAYDKKKDGWKRLYEENMIKEFQNVLLLIKREIEEIKNMKENRDYSFNDNFH
ncbi:hypothetical protein ABES80_12325 [Bacillus gobiensis]|uniref:hypothetical protein n=1 Tax=Bacillus gobiensis TaxID=1441095 RepID=UPI003D1D6A67